MVVADSTAARCAADAMEQKRKPDTRFGLGRDHTFGFDDPAADRLLEMDDNHFWLRPRRRLVLKLLRRLKHADGARTGSILEIGCGSGALLPELGGLGDNVVALDFHIKLLKQARRRFPQALIIEGNAEQLPLVEDRFGIILALDVIEHTDPILSLKEARRVAREGAFLLLSVPASPALWSKFDVRAGHRKRYTRADLVSELALAGWRPIGTTHYQFILYPVVWMLRSLLPVSAEQIRPSRLLNRMLAAANELEVSLLSRMSLPFGSSLICWATTVPGSRRAA
jgi:SAM-dependent methyltransferase